MRFIVNKIKKGDFNLCFEKSEQAHSFTGIQVAVNKRTMDKIIKQINMLLAGYNILE